MTFLDVLEFRTVSQGALSQDGRKFAYTLSRLDWRSGRRFTGIWLTEFNGKPTRQITFTPGKDESSPAFSPNGQWLAYLSNRDAGSGATAAEPAWQLYLLSLDGGEARRISPGAGTVGEFAFSRDGHWIAFTAGEPQARQIYLYDLARQTAAPLTGHATGVARMAWAPDSSQIYFTAPDASDPFEKRRKELRFDVRIVDPPVPAQHLWRVSLVLGHPESRLTAGDFSVTDFRISSDGRWVSFTGAPLLRSPEKLDRRDSEAYLLDTANLQLERLTRNQVAESVPIVSPDGRWVAFTAPDEFTYFRGQKIYVRPARGGDWKKLLGSWDWEPRDLVWAADSRNLYFDAGVGTADDLFSVDVAGDKVVRLTDASGVVTMRFAEDPVRFLLTYETPTRPRDYYVVSPGDIAVKERWGRMSNANPEVGEFAFGATETVQWKSTDGQTVEGILIKPAGFEAGKRYPLIVQVHGGPASAFTRSFPSSFATYPQVYSAGAYAVLQVNYRGSSNYGEKFRTAIVGDYFRQGFDDIMTGVDEMVRRGIADPDKLGLMGWSAGGHWSNWALTHTDRFKAIATGAGVADWISLYAESDTRQYREQYLGGTPYDAWDRYVAESPIRFVKNAKTPTLIEVGENDARVPRAQSEELHVALEKLGVPTEFIVFPRMGHTLTDPRYQMVKMAAEYGWFEKWIRGKKDWLDWETILNSVPGKPKEDAK